MVIHTKIDSHPSVDRLFFPADDTGSPILEDKGIERLVVKKFPDRADEIDSLFLWEFPHPSRCLEIDRIQVPFFLLVGENHLGKVQEGSEILAQFFLEVFRLVLKFHKSRQSRLVLVRPSAIGSWVGEFQSRHLFHEIHLVEQKSFFPLVDVKPRSFLECQAICVEFSLS